MRFDSPKDDAVQYRPVSGLAVVGFLAGLLCSVGLVSPLMWPLAPLGIVLSAAALWRIAARAPALIGRKLAMIGLALSITFTVAFPADWVVHRWLIRRSARQFAQRWLDAIRAGDAAHAHQLMLQSQYRELNDDQLLDFYRKGPRWQQELKTMAETPAVRALLALGPKARVRYYDVSDEAEFEARQWMRLYYAVTFEDEVDLKTFFIAISLECFTTKDESRWRVVRCDGGVQPPGWDDSP
jgi:hypothetical protein